MKVLITCGPAWEPIDEVRRLTNFSTGELGTILAERFAMQGAQVVCLRGEGSTFREPTGVRTVLFSTNDELTRLIGIEAGEGGYGMVLHAAALCDFRVKKVTDGNGAILDGKKLSSRNGEVHVVLEPVPKLLAGFRRLFPSSLIVGWKYERDGTREEALGLAKAQIGECGTDACVVNGRAFGAGFVWVGKEGETIEYLGKRDLAEGLWQLTSNN